jgi:large-conductance mechanosensitive channel
MKISGKGILVIILFLVVIPVIIELILMFVLPKNGPGNFSMTKPLFLSYGRLIPLYIIYLIIAFAIMYLIKNWRKIINQK